MVRTAVPCAKYGHHNAFARRCGLVLFSVIPTSGRFTKCRKTLGCVNSRKAQIYSKKSRDFFTTRRKNATQENAKIGSESILWRRVALQQASTRRRRNETHCLALYCEPAFSVRSWRIVLWPWRLPVTPVAVLRHSSGCHTSLQKMFSITPVLSLKWLSSVMRPTVELR